MTHLAISLTDSDRNALKACGMSESDVIRFLRVELNNLISSARECDAWMPRKREPEPTTIGRASW